jgi:hypothetical protein
VNNAMEGLEVTTDEALRLASMCLRGSRDWSMAATSSEEYAEDRLLQRVEPDEPDEPDEPPHRDVVAWAREREYAAALDFAEQRLAADRLRRANAFGALTEHR